MNGKYIANNANLIYIYENINKIITKVKQF